MIGRHNTSAHNTPLLNAPAHNTPVLNARAHNTPVLNARARFLDTYPHFVYFLEAPGSAFCIWTGTRSSMNEQRHRP